MTDDFPSRWPVRCPRCARRVTVEIEHDSKAGRMGIVECPEGHPFVFRYDGVTVGALAPREGAAGSAGVLSGGR